RYVMFRKIVIVMLFVLALALAACGGVAEAPLPTLVEVTPLPAATDPLPADPPTAEPTATDPPPTEPPTAEPTIEPTATTDPQLDFLWRDVSAETIGGTSQWTNKVELADINGDGWVDLLFANGGYYDVPEPPLSSFVFLNHGPDQPYEEVA